VREISIKDAGTVPVSRISAVAANLLSIPASR